MSPLVTLANAGTPLMWGACGWLVLGNIFIGLLEWKLAAKRLARPLSQGWFIIANYASAICGFLAVDLVKQKLDLVLAGFAGLIAMWIGAFTLTLLVEGVFFWLQVRTPGFPAKTSGRPSLSSTWLLTPSCSRHHSYLAAQRCGEKSV